MRRLARSAPLLVALSLAAAASFATPQVARADAHESEASLARKRRAYALMVEGQSRFDLGKFDEAIDLFQKAYEVYPYPEALYSIAQGHRMKKDYERAVFFYKSYLRNSPDAANRASVEARIQEMEGLIAAQQASATTPPQGVEKPPAPDGASRPAPADGVPADASPAPAKPPNAAPGTSAAPAAWYADGWGWTLVASGATLAAGGSWLVADGAPPDVCVPGDQVCSDAERTARNERFAGWSAIGVGGAAFVLGVVKLSLTDAPRDRSTSVVLGPRYLGVAGTF
jgi:tetratricopeptide (TPR) repeat protein